jgi:hypothetical protein
VSVARGCEVLKVYSLTTVRSANLGGEVHHPYGPFSVQSAASTWPHASQLQICALVCCLW